MSLFLNPSILPSLLAWTGRILSCTHTRSFIKRSRPNLEELELSLQHAECLYCHCPDSGAMVGMGNDDWNDRLRRHEPP